MKRYFSLGAEDLGNFRAKAKESYRLIDQRFGEQLYRLQRAYLYDSADIAAGSAFDTPIIKKDFLKAVFREMIPTRTGINPTDRTTPFYSMDSDTLWNFYYGYANECRYEFLEKISYADTIAFKPPGLEPAYGRFIEVDDVRTILDASFWKLPNELQLHGNTAVDLFKTLEKITIDQRTGEFENNVSFRIQGFEPNGEFKLEKARYFDQVATNLTLDWASSKLGRHQTIRTGIERPVAGKLPPLANSILANTVGTAVLFYDQKLRPILRTRVATLASIPKRGLHCSVSGVLEAVNEYASNTRGGFEIFLPGTHLEIKNEMGLEPHEYELWPVAFSRELARGGKPQLFFAAIALVDELRLRDAAEHAKEKGEYVQADDFNIQSWDNAYEKFTYEGWAALHFADKFLQTNLELLRKFSR